MYYWVVVVVFIAIACLFGVVLLGFTSVVTKRRYDRLITRWIIVFAHIAITSAIAMFFILMAVVLKSKG
jgi:hypothetical protein